MKLLPVHSACHDNNFMITGAGARFWAGLLDGDGLLLGGHLLRVPAMVWWRRGTATTTRQR
ncbi:hypothetical protein ACN263_13925 [Micromonospora sp. WMMD729]|uniref:hypothetical protein n=1 Tax=Micromonospora sp. WMMD729 TaxID=3404127 RepID=UPI003BF47FA9